MVDTSKVKRALSLFTLCLFMLYMIILEYFDFHRTFNSDTPNQCTTPGKIALTFDHGVSEVTTPIVLNTLKAFNLRATFHIRIDSLNAFNPNDPKNQIIKRIVAENHVLGLAWQGVPPYELSHSSFQTILTRNSDFIFQLVHVKPKFIRFYDFKKSIPKRHQLYLNKAFVTTQSNLHFHDFDFCFRNQSASDIQSYSNYILQPILTKKENTSFIVLHTDLCPNSNILSYVIENIQSQTNFKFVTLQECLGLSSAYRNESEVTNQSTLNNVKKYDFSDIDLLLNHIRDKFLAFLLQDKRSIFLSIVNDWSTQTVILFTLTFCTLLFFYFSHF